eukprot:gene11578-21815_t
MQSNPFGHLSELLGLKGSFIPSQSRQRWLADEEENRNEQRNDESSSLEKIVTHPEMGSSELSAMKGTLPLDVSPQQAALITSTAESNEQRRKFMDWEKQGGSMDTRHFPSTFIKGGDSTASKRVSTQRNPDAVSVSIRQGANSYRVEGGHMKNEVHRSENVERILNELNPNADSLTTETNVAKNQPEPSQDKPEIYKALENKDKKRFVGFMPNQFGVLDGNHGLSNEVLPGHSLFGSAMHDQPLTHDMINKLQLDPAWDAMEVKILAQHGQRVIPMQMPMTKIEKEMMPPDGIPVGQAYLPANHHMHSSMLENLQSDAGQAMAQGSADGHALNVGGAIVQTVGNPWKNLKQTTYDHADDNFPLASMNEQTSTPSSVSEGSAAVEGEKMAEEETESVGKPLTKVKGKKFKAKEVSKAVESKDDKKDDEDVKGGKQSFRVNARKKPGLVFVKGKKFGRNQNQEDDEKEEKEIDRKIKNYKQRKFRPSLKQKEQNSEEDDDENAGEMLKLKSKKIQQSRVQTDTDDEDQGPKFSKQESNSQYSKLGGKPQMRKGQQWHMEPGAHQQQFKDSKQVNVNSGKYITHKFVNFLSDVAQHLNVDKLSIAEQLVKDVEESKKSNGRKSAELASEGQLMKDLQGIAEKRGRLGDNQLGSSNSDPMRIRRKQPTVIKYIWNKGISVLKEN